MAKKSKLKKIQIIYWYESIKYLGNFNSPGEMENYFEPLSELVSETVFRNKWRRYGQGLHMPSSELINKVDKQICIPRKIICHYFWTLSEKYSLNNIDNELLQLNPYFVTLLYEFSPVAQRHQKTFQKVDIEKLFLTLITIPLDCLSVLYLYWIQNELSDDKSSELGQVCARRIYQALLIMGGLSHYCSSDRIIRLLYEWFEENVFLKTYWGGKSYGMNTEIFIQNVNLVKCLVITNNKNEELQSIENFDLSYPKGVLHFFSEGLSKSVNNNVYQLSQLLGLVPDQYHLDLDIMLFSDIKDYDSRYESRNKLCDSFIGKIASYDWRSNSV